MDAIGATILKQLQTLSSRANTLVNRLTNDAIPTARALQREVRSTTYDLETISESFNRQEAQWMQQAATALNELSTTR